jgi:RimJ/RimL family protein N-acetyltransferase
MWSGLDGAPEFALALGKLVANFADLEHALSLTLSALTDCPEYMTQRMLGAIRNTSGKVDLCLSLVEFLARDAAKAKIKDFLNEFRSISKQRNRFMHLSYMHDGSVVKMIDHGQVGNKRIIGPINIADIDELARRCQEVSMAHMKWVVLESHNGMFVRQSS